MQTDTFKIVAIDGGAASGKSSTARLLAERRGLLHVDTGLHYRALTHACNQADIEPDVGAGLEACLRGLAVGSCVREREIRMTINGIVPEMAVLRSDAVNTKVSLFAAMAIVRDAVKSYQRSLVEVARSAGAAGIVMDGRDIGTVILPGADLKVFLQADDRTRQARRNAEGQSDVIRERDRVDSTRQVAPLRPAADALVIDTAQLTLAQVVALIEARLWPS